MAGERSFAPVVCQVSWRWTSGAITPRRPACFNVILFISMVIVVCVFLPPPTPSLPAHLHLFLFFFVPTVFLYGAECRNMAQVIIGVYPPVWAPAEIPAAESQC